MPYANVTPEGLREMILHLLRNDDEVKQAILDGLSISSLPDWHPPPNRRQPIMRLTADRSNRIEIPALEVRGLKLRVVS